MVSPSPENPTPNPLPVYGEGATIYAKFPKNQKSTLLSSIFVAPPRLPGGGWGWFFLF
jgi:hypothetical protein